MQGLVGNGRQERAKKAGHGLLVQISRDRSTSSHLVPPIEIVIPRSRELFCPVDNPAFGFRVLGFGFRVSDLGFRILDFRFRVSGFGFRVSGFGYMILHSGSRFRASD